MKKTPKNMFVLFIFHVCHFKIRGKKDKITVNAALDLGI